MSEQRSCNIASHLPEMARRQPFKRAVVVPSGRDGQGRVLYAHLTFSQLNELSDRYAQGLERIGIRRGMRTVLMVKPSLEFFGLVFALFKIGTPLILIDPGLDRRALLTCFAETEPEAFIGIPAAHVARLLFRSAFQTVRISVTVGPRLFWGGHALKDVVEQGPYRPYQMAETRPEELAAILFTSGSTGIPKGALYTHGVFDAQVRLLQKTYGFAPDELDLATFPLFALFDPALGMTAVIPDMDARKPGSADPRKLIEAIEDQGVTQMFGSPALLDRLSRYAEEHSLKLPSLKRIISAGAPMTPSTLARTANMLTGGAQVFTPYGATESLPVCNIGSREILEETRQRTATGEGICVGKPVAEMTVRIIRITDDAIAEWSDGLELPAGQIGEITVRGPVVTAGYYAREAQTRLAKIIEKKRDVVTGREESVIVHRMGDVGWMDAEGRVWMCGRKSHRVETARGTLFSVPVEEIFNQHPEVKRSALVWLGERPQQTPVLCIERGGSERLPAPHSPEPALRQQLLALGQRHAITQEIQHILFYPKPFPVDIRHNAKIAREQLARWVAERGLNG